MKPTAKQRSLACLLLSLLPLSLIMPVEHKKSVETNLVSATQVDGAIPFHEEPVFLKTPITTSTIVTTTTTTTIPPTTTTQQPRPVVSDGVNWDAIAECESHGNWSTNTGNGYYGGLQFHHDTWIAYGGGVYAENAHLTSRENQIHIASGMDLSHWPICGKYG